MSKTQINYGAAVLLGICWGWLFFTFILSRFDFKEIISPITQQLFNRKQVTPKISGFKLFSFSPGWAYNYIDRVDLSGIEAIAHFDVPVNDDGTLMQDTTGYQLLSSDKTIGLFQQARSQGVKPLITISQTDTPTIKAIVDNPAAQQTLIDESLSAMNDSGATGININFEFRGEASNYYRTKFSAFIKNVTNQIHSKAPGSFVAVTMYPKATGENVYDLPTIGAIADRIFVQAYDFPVPEVKDGKVTAPEYAGKQSDYLAKVAGVLKEFSEQVPANKIALERAWYGNGENYPMYQPDFTKAESGFFSPSIPNDLKTPLSKDVVDELVSQVPQDAQGAARKNLPLIADALQREGILNRNVLAYALATIEHETAGTFEPIAEFKGPKSARRLGYEGGTDYYGRGFIQLTHLRNYEKMSERLGLGDLLAKEPDLVMKPEIAAAVLAVFFKETGVAQSASQGDFVDARTPINPDYMGWQIATLAFKYVI